MGVRRPASVGVFIIGLALVAAAGCGTTASTDGVAAGGSGSSTTVGATDGTSDPLAGDPTPTTCATIPVTTVPGIPSDEEGECAPPEVPPIEPSDDDGSQPIITMLSPKGDASWPASTGITDAARAALAAAYDGYDGALLVPPPGRWPDPTTVEARVDGFAPDPGYVSMNVVVREVAVGAPVVTVAGASVASEPYGTRACSSDSASDPDARIIRGAEGCKSSDGTITFVWWSEAGNRFQAESATLDADALIAELANWELLPAAEL